jgi:putative endonuclease
MNDRQTNPNSTGGWASWGGWLRRWWYRLFPPLTLGAQGERAAARYLRRIGYRIVARGARSRLGEIDLIALDGQTIVFVEVKTRRSKDQGHPVEAVDLRKRQRLTRLALAYLKRYGLLRRPARFDVIAITWPQGERPTIEHFPNAFPAEGRVGFYS